MTFSVTVWLDTLGTNWYSNKSLIFLLFFIKPSPCHSAGQFSFVKCSGSVDIVNTSPLKSVNN